MTALALETRLNEWQESFDKAMYEGDIEKIMSEFYHPQAALVAYGKVSFGLEGMFGIPNTTAGLHLLMA